MNTQLPIKNVGKRVAHKIRVLFFDPTTLYKRVTVDPLKRTQSIGMEIFFPPNKSKKCRCGCNKALTGRRTAWASTDCSRFAGDIQAIINGHTPTIKKYLMMYHGWSCVKCGVFSTIKMDHIIGVKHGGGGCWLSNFQLLCHTCHVAKTNKDFGYKKSVKKKVN